MLQSYSKRKLLFLNCSSPFRAAFSCQDALLHFERLVQIAALSSSLLPALLSCDSCSFSNALYSPFRAICVSFSTLQPIRAVCCSQMLLSLSSGLLSGLGCSSPFRAIRFCLSSLFEWVCYIFSKDPVRFQRFAPRCPQALFAARL